MALRLCEVLPNSVYAKHGHGRAKPGKPRNLFHSEKKLQAFLEDCRVAYDHVVLESNRWARRGSGDIIIYVGGEPRGERGARGDADELRRRAHVRIGSRAEVTEWKSALRDKLKDRRLREAVCEVLREQQCHVDRPRPDIRTKVWFVLGDKHVFGSGISGLLENIHECGTLSGAARAAHMSYRYAWSLIRKAEQHWGRRLILPHTGGPGGGGTRLTRDGLHLLDVFQKVREDVAAYADKRFQTLQEEEVNRD
jgi:molybdate transport system regulatory protein